MKYKVANPCTCILSPAAIWLVDQAPRQTLYLVKPKPSARLLLKSSGSLWTSPLAVEPLICQWVLHEWLLVAETPNTQGVYFLQLRSYSGQEKEPRSPQRVLCSVLEECLDPVDPLYNQNQDPETYEAGAGGPQNLNVFIFSVDAVKRRWGRLSGPRSIYVCFAVYIVCVIFAGRQRRSRSSRTSWACRLPWPERWQGERTNISSSETETFTQLGTKYEKYSNNFISQWHVQKQV